MVRSFAGGLCAVGLAALMTSMASAATIQEVLAIPFNPTAEDFYATGYGHSAYLLTWDNSSGNLAPAGHRPGGPPEYGPAGGNPAWLMFNYLGGGGGFDGDWGGGGAPIEAANSISTFELGNNLGGPWSMDFSVLIYDADFTGDEVNVIVQGEDWSDPFNIRTVSLEMAEVVGGRMLTWHIAADAGETVKVSIQSLGDESYAAGFFMDNETMLIPEPATVGLLAAGLACLVARRRRR